MRNDEITSGKPPVDPSEDHDATASTEPRSDTETAAEAAAEQTTEAEPNAPATPAAKELKVRALVIFGTLNPGRPQAAWFAAADVEAAKAVADRLEFIAIDLKDARQRRAEGPLGKKLISPAARFAIVERVITDHGYSERRACGLIGVDRSSFQDRRKTDGDAAVRVRLRELANERRRFGYRRLAILLRREGVRMNLKKVYRLYREERLAVRRRGGRKRALGTRAPMAVLQRD